MRKLSFISCFFLFSLMQFGCSDEAARNRNAQIVESYNAAKNVNSANTNGNTGANSNSVDEEVPKFDNAAEALKKGEEYLDANSSKNAVDALTQSTELDPDFAEAHFKLGVAYLLLEKENDADPYSDKSEPEKKNSEKAFENSVKAYKKLVRANSKSPDAYYNLGRAYNKLYNDKEAEKAHQKAVKLNPEDSLYRTELGAALIKLARYSSAIKHLEKAIELDEDNFRAVDLLVKAKAGRKRTGFKSKQKVRRRPTAVKKSAPKVPKPVKKAVKKPVVKEQSPVKKSTLQ